MPVSGVINGNKPESGCIEVLVRQAMLHKRELKKDKKITDCKLSNTMTSTNEVSSSNGGFLSRMALNDNKAGMEGLDKEKINKIIMEATKGSRFYENELKKDQQVNQRIEKMMHQKAHITEQQLRKAQLQVDKFVMELEQGRDLSHTIVHIDMDAFYAAVEMKDNPELRDKPMAVGSMSMLSTSNYHARKFGVRAAMPGFIAKKLCPGLIIVPLNFEKYRAVSKEVQEILAGYDPNFLTMSLDEAYLDITEHLKQRQNWPEHRRTFYIGVENTTKNDEEKLSRKEEQQPCERGEVTSPILFDDSPSLPPEQDAIHTVTLSNSHALQPKEETSQQQQSRIVFGVSVGEMVREMRFLIEQKTKLTASAGIAPNMMLAKVCSDKNKPNGQYRIPADRQAVMDFIKDLPTRKVPGIGKVTEKMLNALGITICTELYQQRALISLLFSEVSWHHFLQISLGLGSTCIVRDGERKSMSTERTFNEMSKPEEQYSLCHDLCSDLAQDLQKEGLKGKTVSIKLKNVNFEVKTRASTVASVVSTEEEIFAIAKELLRTEIENAEPQPLQLRLMGVRVSGFLNEEEKKCHQKSIINFFQNQKQESAQVAANDSAKPSAQIPDAPSAESFFNKKLAARNQNKQRSFFAMVAEKRAQDMPGSGQPSAAESSESFSLRQALTCPVCLREQEADLESFNRHIDDCLSHPSSDDRLPPQGFNGEDHAAECTSGKTQETCHAALTPYRDGTLANEGSPCEKLTIVAGADEVTNYEGRSPEAIRDRSGVVGGELSKSGLPGQSPPFKDTLRVSEGDCEETGHASERSAMGSKMSREEDCQSNLSPTQNKSVEGADNRKSGDGQEMSPMENAPESHSTGLGSTLLCPICSLVQQTSDLEQFNRHVDICLNRGIIQELTEEQSCLANTNITTNTKNIGFSGRGQRSANFTARNKRPGAPEHRPTMKKSRPNNVRNTIDKFFK
ncbi:DNA polymerase kappa isoform X2 [Latimeria chalumnae]|uniref:DNA polymerase kappa isoform X2 n=1 Tax=Latimeria chalumnae TaxID=7897 RepID=UPI0003C168D8|nr:PREDICTED: DNA polymerase kappa isoform X2 [Latimeria chalumnae]|eukprot:XP_014350448.1 PREDICTED: DNA polymerase kappa isoform X2 [Latimeria chalumnae]